MNDLHGPVIAVQAVSKTFRSGGSSVVSSVALDEMDLKIEEPCIVALQGQSGCGKTTLLRVIAGIETPDKGAVLLDGQSLFDLKRRERRAFVSSRLRMIFQHPDAALNPATSVMHVLRQAMLIHRPDVVDPKAEAARFLDMVRLSSEYLDRMPHELSGGEKKRIGIARALITKPKVILADEPLAGFDLPLQVEMLDMLEKLQREQGFCFLFTTHDGDHANRIADRVISMKDGRLLSDTTLASAQG